MAQQPDFDDMSFEEVSRLFDRVYDAYHEKLSELPSFEQERMRSEEDASNASAGERHLARRLDVLTATTTNVVRLLTEIRDLMKGKTN